MVKMEVGSKCTAAQRSLRRPACPLGRQRRERALRHSPCLPSRLRHKTGIARNAHDGIAQHGLAQVPDIFSTDYEVLD